MLSTNLQNPIDFNGQNILVPYLFQFILKLLLNQIVTYVCNYSTNIVFPKYN